MGDDLLEYEMPPNFNIKYLEEVLKHLLESEWSPFKGEWDSTIWAAGNDPWAPVGWSYSEGDEVFALEPVGDPERLYKPGVISVEATTTASTSLGLWPSVDGYRIIFAWRSSFLAALGFVA